MRHQFLLAQHRLAARQDSLPGGFRRGSDSGASGNAAVTDEPMPIRTASGGQGQRDWSPRRAATLGAVAVSRLCRCWYAPPGAPLSDSSMADRSSS